MDNMMIEFMNLVMEGLSKKLTSVSLQTKEIVKLNGIKLHSITITGEQSNLSPCIYLDSYYEDYRSGKVDIAHIVDNIIAVYNRNSLENNLDTSLFTDYSKASKLLYGRLVNTEMNKELLETVPHREFLDLSLIYTVVLNLNNETGNIHITNEHMQRWGVSENDLYCQVKTNMETNKEYTIQSMAEVIQCLAGDDTDTFLPEINKDNCPMYVLTNKKQFNGAVEIINEKVLSEFANMIGKDFVMLPSSIHEWLLIPVSDTMNDMDYFAQMVKEVNDTQVATNELLSYHVYKYERATGSMKIAA